MITQQEAESIAQAILGRSAGDAARPWSLEEFEQGWLIRERPLPGEKFIGDAQRVVERESGRALLFPSSVPPLRIINEYPAIQDRGVVEEA